LLSKTFLSIDVFIDNDIFGCETNARIDSNNCLKHPFKQMIAIPLTKSVETFQTKRTIEFKNMFELK